MASLTNSPRFPGPPDGDAAALAWTRLLDDVTSNPDTEDALRGVVMEAAAVAGAVAGLVVQLPSRQSRAAWGCHPEAIAGAFAEGAALGAAVKRQDEWRNGTLWLPGRWPIGAPAADADHAWLVPLQVREVASGTLVLLFHDAPARPHAGTEEAVCNLGRLAALVLDNDRLLDEAQQARHLRDDFLTAINHELRTPATAFVLDAFLIRSGMYGALPVALERHLQQIEGHLETVTRVLEGVLSLGQTPGAPPGYGEVFQPRQIVLNLLRRIEPAAKRKNLPIMFYAPRTLPMIQGDVTAFSRVLLHLLSNAVKYTTEGKIEVRVEQTTRTLGRQVRERVLVVRISDTGCGIPAEHLSRIFEPFVQVEEGARTDSRTRGVGLGLSVAHKLARAMRGEIAMESVVGRGTVVSFVLPYHH